MKIVRGGTSEATTAPDPMMAPSPTSTPGRITEFPPILTPLCIFGPLRGHFFCIIYLSLRRTAHGPMKASSSIVVYDEMYTPV